MKHFPPALSDYFPKSSQPNATTLVLMTLYSPEIHRLSFKVRTSAFAEGGTIGLDPDGHVPMCDVPIIREDPPGCQGQGHRSWACSSGMLRGQQSNHVCRNQSSADHNHHEIYRYSGRIGRVSNEGHDKERYACEDAAGTWKLTFLHPLSSMSVDSDVSLR